MFYVYLCRINDSPCCMNMVKKYNINCIRFEQIKWRGRNVNFLWQFIFLLLCIVISFSMCLIQKIMECNQNGVVKLWLKLTFFVMHLSTNYWFSVKSFCWKKQSTYCYNCIWGAVERNWVFTFLWYGLDSCVIVFVHRFEILPPPKWQLPFLLVQFLVANKIVFI